MDVHVSFCCGTDIISSDQMMAISHLVSSWFQTRFFWSRAMKITAYVSLLLAKCTKKKISYEMRAAMGSGRFCLLLAFGKQLPRKLESSLKVVRQLQCSDERDRIYSILSLVDWPSGISPVPDYDKSAFDLAVETLGILFCDQRRARAYRFFEAAELLEELFNLLPMYESIHEAISTAPEPVGSKWDEHSRSRTATRAWHATKIHPTSSLSDEFAQLHVIGAPDDNEMNLLVDDNGVPFAEASARTQAGDWYIETYMYGLDSWDMLGLVIRASENSSLTVVGLARKLGNHRRRVVEDTWVFRKEKLTVYWDSEDALLLHMWILNSIHDNRLDDVRICRFENSSYAEFDNPKAVRRQDEEVWGELPNWVRREAHNVESCYTKEAIEAYPVFYATTQKSRWLRQST
jgi:hypothetical protein